MKHARSHVDNVAIIFVAFDDATDIADIMRQASDGHIIRDVAGINSARPLKMSCPAR